MLAGSEQSIPTDRAKGIICDQRVPLENFYNKLGYTAQGAAPDSVQQRSKLYAVLLHQQDGLGIASPRCLGRAHTIMVDFSMPTACRSPTGNTVFIEDCLQRRLGNVSLSYFQVLNAILYDAERGCK